MTRGQPSPAARGVWSGIGYAAFLLAISGISLGVSKLGEVFDLPWLPYVVLIVGLGVAMGLIKWAGERRRVKRAARARPGETS